MEFHGSVLRWRRPLLPDPYNPDREIRADWVEAVPAEMSGAWVASSSSSATRNGDRMQVMTAKSLFLDDPFADVQTGDGISVPGAAGPAYVVEASPTADYNPFTGWHPVREIPLVEHVG